MEGGDLFVELLGELVDLVGVLSRVSVGPELNLGKNLVGERGGHDEGRVSGGASEVEESSVGKEDDSVSVGELVAVNLSLDGLVLDFGPFLETSGVDFVIEVSDVSDDGVVLHLAHVGGHNDVLVSGGSDEDISLLDDLLESDDVVSLHAGLESADRVDLSDVDSGSASLHGGGASLSDISESADDGLLSGDHDVGGSEDTIWQGVSASVDVIELGLSD